MVARVAAASLSEDVQGLNGVLVRVAQTVAVNNQDLLVGADCLVRVAVLVVEVDQQVLRLLENGLVNVLGD